MNNLNKTCNNRTDSNEENTIDLKQFGIVGPDVCPRASKIEIMLEVVFGFFEILLCI